MTTIIVFQQRGSGAKKIEGIERYGKNITLSRIIDIDAALPDFIESPEEFITSDFSCDLVLSFLAHPDLLHYLAKICADKKIPIIASGKQCAQAITPFTCCGLGRLPNLGEYGQQFGLPEFTVRLQGNIITHVDIQRGASCGATWEAMQSIIGLDVATALSTLPREVQYRCIANPAAFDPVSGKSSLHYAGDVHIAALKKAVRAAEKETAIAEENKQR